MTTKTSDVTRGCISTFVFSYFHVEIDTANTTRKIGGRVHFPVTMDEAELITPYFDIAKYYSNIIGIWPFDKGWKKRVVPRLLYISCSMSLLSLISRILVYFSFSMVTEQIPYICVAMIMLIKHINCFKNESKFSNILRNMNNDWKEMKTAEEVAIMETYAKKGVFYAFLYRINVYFGVSAFAIVPLIPPILDLIQPLNESRPRMFSYDGYYIFDPYDYYYTIAVYNFLHILLVGVVLISTDSFIIHVVQHACALLLLAGHRFKHAVDTIEYSNKSEQYALRGTNYRKLRLAFRSHNRAMQHLADIESVYTINLVLQLFVMIISFSITLFEIAMKDIGANMFRLYAFLVSQTVHMLFLTIQGQFVLDLHDVVYNMIYEALWYTETSKLQVLYVMALRRSLTPHVLTAGGLMRLDLNSFAELIKLCVSYYTVLRSS